MQEPSWELADAVARELVSRETDVNEVQKVATHARVQAERQAERVGEDFFALLETMVRDGRYLVRSGRTLDYYRDLRDVCGRHLREFKRTTPESGWELVGILFWAARLMRYYKSAEAGAELSPEQHVDVRAERRGAVTAVAEQHAARMRSAAPTDEPHPGRKSPPPRLPVAPKAKPREEIKRETVTLVSAVKTGKARITTRRGEELTCTGMPSYPPAVVGEDCRADVTRVDGRATKAVFKGWVS